PCMNDTVERSFGAYHFESAVDRRLLKIRQVHRHLRLTTYQEPVGFDEAQAPGRKPHCFCDLFCNLDVGRIQKNVIGDQELARSNNASAGGGVKPGFAEIWLARGIRGNVLANSLKFPAPDVLQALVLARL